jgi:glycosyltransferase involved in cell wall biosynthesis
MRRTPHHQIAISGFVASVVEGPSTVVPFGLADRPAAALADRTVVVIQRLEAEKDTSTAVRAWARSGLGNEGWQLVIAGDGAERPALEALAAQLGQASSVRFLGHVHGVDALRSAASAQLTTGPRRGFRAERARGDGGRLARDRHF